MCLEMLRGNEFSDLLFLETTLHIHSRYSELGFKKRLITHLTMNFLEIDREITHLTTSVKIVLVQTAVLVVNLSKMIFTLCLHQKSRNKCFEAFKLTVSSTLRLGLSPLITVVRVSSILFGFLYVKGGLKIFEFCTRLRRVSYQYDLGLIVPDKLRETLKIFELDSDESSLLEENIPPRRLVKQKYSGITEFHSLPNHSTNPFAS
jgi:hypothetical protein